MKSATSSRSEGSGQLLVSIVVRCGNALRTTTQWVLADFLLVVPPASRVETPVDSPPAPAVRDSEHEHQEQDQGGCNGEPAIHEFLLWWTSSTSRLTGVGADQVEAACRPTHDGDGAVRHEHGLAPTHDSSQSGKPQPSLRSLST
ncbi:hypothetical protein D187_009816 [Cystobacter fuscus DSM 2262]|uniref:Uncharacterized protein n=1 Tax=Cystobacter fuscus (strain ATCC 25194 / DSM 2262 / NBRC 100088 / M29) TaxID=1242864 RepID=S9P5P5_CYSF2|nr:hypothetical protein D187_009816 [Cystobacter fuscus DSM 2262]